MTKVIERAPAGAPGKDTILYGSYTKQVRELVLLQARTIPSPLRSKPAADGRSVRRGRNAIRHYHYR